MSTSIEDILIRWQGIEWNKSENQERNMNAARLLHLADWQALLQLASSLNQNQPVMLLPQFTLGAHHMIRALQFLDGSYWVARLAMASDHNNDKDIIAEAEANMQRECDILALIKERTNVPVPTVFAFLKKEQNRVGAPIMFMEFCLGNAVMDLSFDYLPEQHKSKFIANLADIQVQLSTLTFDKIGSIVRKEDGTYEVGPLPGIGGPFSTTAEFLKAWYQATTFRHDDSVVLAHDDYYGPQILQRIRHFRNAILAGAFDDHPIQYNSGPFVLKHIDLGQNNIVVDHDYKIVGIVDWEGAFSAPLLLAEMPKILSICPSGMGVDNRGLPPTVNVDQRMYDREEYWLAVKRAEPKYRGQGILSEVLANNRDQQVGAALRMYYDPGHLGLYCSFLPEKHRFTELEADLTG